MCISSVVGQQADGHPLLVQAWSVLVWYEAVCSGCLPSTLLTRTCVDWRQHRALQSPRSRRAAKVTKGVFVKRKRRRKSSQVEGQTGVFTLEGVGRQPKFQRPAGGAVSVTKVWFSLIPVNRKSGDVTQFKYQHTVFVPSGGLALSYLYFVVDPLLQ